MNHSDSINLSRTQGERPDGTGLLSASDPHPVDLRHAHSAAPVFLLCEHAGQAVPKALDGLGLPEGEIDRHIGWDIGAEKLACAIADRLKCPLILQRYSRLVIDCNRPPLLDGSIPERSDGITVPGNTRLEQADHDLRRRAIFDPMNDAITSAFETHPRQAVFSIHSYTRHLQGQDRRWDAGFLTRQDQQSAHRLMAAIASAAPELNLALNQPYQIEDASDWFIPRFAEARGMRHALIEVRNDHLRDNAGIARWADLLAHAIQTVLEDVA